MPHAYCFLVGGRREGRNHGNSIDLVSQRDTFDFVACIIHVVQARHRKTHALLRTHASIRNAIPAANSI